MDRCEDGRESDVSITSHLGAIQHPECDANSQELWRNGDFYRGVVVRPARARPPIAAWQGRGDAAYNRGSEKTGHHGGERCDGSATAQPPDQVLGGRVVGRVD